MQILAHSFNRHPLHTWSLDRLCIISLKLIYHFTFIRITLSKKKKKEKNKCWQGYSETGTLVHCWWECKRI